MNITFIIEAFKINLMFRYYLIVILFNVNILQAQELISSLAWNFNEFENTEIYSSEEKSRETTNAALESGASYAKIKIASMSFVTPDFYILAYPSMSNSEFVIKTDIDHLPMSYRIKNSNGNVVSEGKIMSTEKRVSVLNYKIGIYYIQVEKDVDHLLTFSFIIN